MKLPPSKRTLRLRLGAWNVIRVLLCLFAWLHISELLASYGRLTKLATSFVVLACLIGGFYLVVASLPRRWRWLAWQGLRSRPQLIPPLSEAFEIDLPCERCGAHNIGVAAAEWVGDSGKIRIFRDCEACGRTQWWRAEDYPRRVRRRSKVAKLSDQCPVCGYALKGVPAHVEIVDAGRVAHSRQCPECGKSQFVTLPAPFTPPPPPRSASRSAAGSGSAGA